MLRNAVTSLLDHEKITTTEVRARDIKRVAEKMITLSKKDDLHTRRQALSYLMNEDIVTKLFTEIGPRYASRNGGYTRLIKSGFRRGDGAPMVIIELVK
jgi:large subunit ribosomal protein L17